MRSTSTRTSSSSAARCCALCLAEQTPMNETRSRSARGSTGESVKRARDCAYVRATLLQLLLLRRMHARHNVKVLLAASATRERKLGSAIGLRCSRASGESRAHRMLGSCVSLSPSSLDNRAVASEICIQTPGRRQRLIAGAMGMKAANGQRTFSSRDCTYCFFFLRLSRAASAFRASLQTQNEG